MTGAKSCDTPKIRAFISYARTNIAFAEDLRERLIRDGLDAYLDTHDIVKGEPWKDRLQSLIESADVMLFLISPASVASEMCDWEINQAEFLGKRICPAFAEQTDMDAVPQRLRRLQISFLQTPEQDAKDYPRLLAAIRQDAAWVREHSRIGELALRWDREQRPSRLLLRGRDIDKAETWRAERAPTAPEVTPLQSSYLLQSRRSATRRLRWWIGGVSLVTAGASALAFVAFIQREFALEQEAEARAAQAVAERNFETTDEALSVLIVDFAQGLKTSDGVPPAVLRSILGRAESMIDGLLENDPENIRLKFRKAAMLSQFGDAYARTGDFDAARKAYAEAVDLARTVVEAEPENPSFRITLSAAKLALGDFLKHQGDFAGAKATYEDVLALNRDSIEKHPETLDFRRGEAIALDRLGDLSALDGDAATAAQFYQEGLALRRALMTEHADDMELRRDLGISLDRIGQLHLQNKKLDEALTAFNESLEIARVLVEQTPHDRLLRRDLSISLERIGDILAQQQKMQLARAHFEEMVAIRRALSESEPENIEARTDLAIGLTRIYIAGEPTRAKAALQEAADIIFDLDEKGLLSEQQKPWVEILKDALQDS